MATGRILTFACCLSFTMFWSCQFTEAIRYRIVKDKSYTTGSPLHEEVVTSRRHCAKLCEAMAACVAAEYDRTTSSCQLLESPLSTATQHEGHDILEMGGKLLHILAWNNFPPFLVTIGYLSKCIIHWDNYPGRIWSCLIDTKVARYILFQCYFVNLSMVLSKSLPWVTSIPPNFTYFPLVISLYN